MNPDPEARLRATAARATIVPSPRWGALFICTCTGASLAPAAAAQDLDADFIRARCEVVHQIENQSILYGMVVDARSGLPLPGGTVHLEWATASGVSDTTRHEVSAETTEGAYIFCDVPQETRLSAWADGLGGRSGREDVYFVGGENERRDLSVGLRRMLGGLSGVLRDAESGLPIVGATVRVPDTGESALTDDEGRFRMREVPIGSHEVAIAHLAYGEPALTVVVESGVSTFVEAALEPRPIALEPISVSIERRPQWLETTGFYDRVAQSLGQHVTPEDLRRRSTIRFSEVLRDVPGIDLRPVCTPHCYHQIRMAGTTQSGCLPTFYMDGRRMSVRPKPRGNRREPEGLFDLDVIAAGSDVAALEVYRSIAETPPEFYGRCGSIVIWTKRGAG